MANSPFTYQSRWSSSTSGSPRLATSSSSGYRAGSRRNDEAASGAVMGSILEDLGGERSNREEGTQRSQQVHQAKMAVAYGGLLMGQGVQQGNANLRTLGATMMEIGTRLLQQWDAWPDPEQTWRSMEDLSISGEELRQRGTEDEITEDEIGENDENAMDHRRVEPRLNVILHRRDPNAPHEEYDDNRRERSRSRDDGQGPPRVASTESQATTEEAVEEAASGAEGHGEGHGHPSHEHQSTPEERDRANLQQRWRTLDRRLNRPRARSDRSSRIITTETTI